MKDILEHEELTYIISHDLQEPIRMINSYMKLLERKYRDKLDDEAIDYIKYAVEGANNLKSMIDDLLSYSRLRKENVKKSSFMLDEIYEKVKKQLSKKYDEKDFEIVNDNTISAEIYADKDQFTLLFLNILDNAIKFNTNPLKKVMIKSSIQDKNIQFCISDNGIGIDRQYSDKVFRIFQKLHNNTEYQGSGIGLAKCKKVIENHDGKIWIESEPGDGTKFYFLLPYLN